MATRDRGQGVNTRRTRAVILLVAAVVVTAVAAVVFLRFRTTAPPIGTHVAAMSAAPTASMAAIPDAQTLVGRWLRGDYSYMIEIVGVAPDGRLDARYFNPDPIHVSRAEAKHESGRLAVFVELNDRGYPGSYYTLTYDPQEDVLQGVYHHLGLQQNFDVGFFRFDGDAPDAALNGR